MQISDEDVKIALAAYKACDDFEHECMRAALEAALGASTEFAKLKEEHEGMGRARCNDVACIEDLAGALKEALSTQEEWEESVSKAIGRPVNVFPRAIDRARATLERWGLK